MTKSCWKKIKSKNPYETHTWINDKKKEMLQIHYDIGFGKQRIERVSERVKELFEGLDKGEISTRDVEKVVKEELNLEYELR